MNGKVFHANEGGIMGDQSMSWPHILQHQFHILCGADRSVMDEGLTMFSQYERRVNEEDQGIISFPPQNAQRRKAA